MGTNSKENVGLVCEVALKSQVIMIALPFVCKGNLGRDDDGGAKVMLERILKNPKSTPIPYKSKIQNILPSTWLVLFKTIVLFPFKGAPSVRTGLRRY